MTDHRSVYVAPALSVTASGEQSAAASRINFSPEATPDDPRVQTIMDDFSVKLAGLGFNIVDTQQEAQAIAYLTMDGVRFDPGMGWLADNGVITFADQTGATVARYQVRTQVLVPTIQKLLDALGASIQDKL